MMKEGRRRATQQDYIRPSHWERARGNLFVAGAYSGSPQVCNGFRNPFLRKRPARISTFKQHEVGRIWASKRAWPTLSEGKDA
jgi:hypothetical protein